MGVISREALKLHDNVRDYCPITYEYAKRIARNWCIPMGQVFMEFFDLLNLMAQKEREKE